MRYLVEGLAKVGDNYIPFRQTWNSEENAKYYMKRFMERDGDKLEYKGPVTVNE